MNKELKSIIKKDFYRYFGDKKPLLWFVNNRTLRCLKVYRKVNFYLKTNKRLRYYFYNFKLKLLSSKYAFNVYAQKKIGGCYINHNGAITINPMVELGDNCVLGAGVTIGRENRGERNGAPSIGNMVWIGANAVVVGKITIGDNVLIAPNAYVNFNVPSNSIVIGNPGKIISNRPNATEGYIKNVVMD